MGKISAKSFYIALTIFLISLFSTYYLSISVKDKLEEQRYLKLENIAKQIAIKFQDSIDIAFNDLQALQAYYSVNQDNPTQADFNKYMQVMDINNRHYIQALSWIPLVKKDDREKFEEYIHSQQPNFNITERSKKEGLTRSAIKNYYTPVTYISPYKKNKAAQGFDLSSNSKRKTSLLHASDSGNMTITSKITLVQETGKSFGFLIIAPVYKKDALISNIKERQLALLGYVTGVFRIDTLMKNARDRADNEGFRLTLSDLDKDDGGLLYGEKSKNSLFFYDINVPDRHWKIGFSLEKNLIDDIESSSIFYWMLFGGVTISILLSTSIYAMKVSIIRAQRISSMGKELQSQNAILEEKVIERTDLLVHKNDELNNHISELNSQRTIMVNLMSEVEAEKIKAEQKAKELERSNKDLDDFAYVASHDLKAPLRGIMQLSSWISEEISDFATEDTKSNLSLLKNRTSRLEKLLEDLLDYSRIGRKTSDLVEINTKEVVLNAFDIQNAPDNFVLKCQEIMPNINSKKTPFETIIRNLISNAIKHNDKREGEIIVSSEEFPDYYEFSVKDNGPGIPSKYHDHIFELFKTLQPRDEVEGSGMGLAIIKKLLRYHNGSITVESEDKTGTCFTFKWPK